MGTNKMRPIHPGEIIREEYLVPLQMTSHALAMALRRARAQDQRHRA
jgi:plasmid maintenance system antidote protein VapI